MAFLKAFSCFVILTLIFMAVSPHVAQSSRPIRQEGKAKSRDISTQKYEMRGIVEASSSSSGEGVVKESAREVPTGPDPLHHNNHPTRP